MKQEFDGNILSPLPIVLLGTLIDERPNYCVIGYISPFDFGNHVFFSLYKKRYTRVGIQENKTFSVNVPSEDLIDEVNICGSKSGRDTDKSILFETFYGELETAPMIRECPLNMECRVTDILDYDPNEGIVGKVIKSYANADLVKDDIVDMRRAGLFAWTIAGDFSFYRLGEQITSESDAED
ncbi:MAG: flavin reductase family protein [Candidatus Coatesbacteria bacterium]|nr:MAG: flavin reductase family protein [Candidatus Coatesbacteria bacterium]